MHLEFLVPLLYPAAIIAFVLSLSKPQMGLYYLTVVLPLQTLRYELFGYPFGGSLIDVVLLGVILGVWIKGHVADLRRIQIIGILLLFSGYTFLSLWHGSFLFGMALPTSFADPRVSVWKSWAEFTVLCVVSFAAIRTRKQIEIVVALMGLTILAVTWDFFQTMSFRDTSHYSWDIRSAGVLGYANPNGFAAFETMFFLFALGLLSRRLPTVLKLILIPCLVASAYGSIFSFSRGAYVGLALGVMAFAGIRRKLWTVVLVGALAAGTALLPSAVTDRVAGTYAQGANTTEATLDSSAQDRVLIWTNAIELTKTHPILGMGFNTYAYLHPYGFKDTHNFYLKILVEEGLIGLAMFLFLLWSMYRQGYRLYCEESESWMGSLGLALAITVLGAAAINFFGDRWSYLQVDSYLWIAVALVCRARLLKDEEPAPEATSEPVILNFEGVEARSAV